MFRIKLAFAGVALLTILSAAYADYAVENRGSWPADWPQELETLRNQARTLEGPMEPNRHYQIPFADRDKFEAAWPYLLKVKSKGAPIFLVRGPKTDFFEIRPAGVLIHTPPVINGKQQAPGAPNPGARNPRSMWTSTAYIELVVDGNIVDLNRIPLPADTPIVDERFPGASEVK